DHRSSPLPGRGVPHVAGKIGARRCRGRRQRAAVASRLLGDGRRDADVARSVAQRRAAWAVDPPHRRVISLSLLKQLTHAVPRRAHSTALRAEWGEDDALPFGLHALASDEYLRPVPRGAPHTLQLPLTRHVIDWE